jgi:glycosyltransferase involved in cell wall biosynthesis
LFLSPLPPPAGGISNWTLAVCESGLQRLFEIRVVSSSPSRATRVSGRSRWSWDRAADAVRIVLRFVRELRRFRPHVVHVNTSYFWGFWRDGLAAFVARAYGAKVVLHIRGGDFPEWVEGLSRGSRRAALGLLERTDRVVAITQPTQHWLEATIGPQRVRYLPNFVPVDARPRAPRPTRGFVSAIFVGWRIPAKGIVELLEAVRPLTQLRLTLVGPEDPGFSATISPPVAALGDRVQIRAEQPRAEIARLLSDADVFVLPTWREGFPNVVLEAMAAGLAIVTTPVGEIPQLIEHEISGLLVPVRDAIALRAALARLIADEPLRQRLGAAARTRATTRYAAEPVLAQLSAIYGELLHPPATRGSAHIPGSS